MRWLLGCVLLLAFPARARDQSMDGVTAGVLVGGCAALAAYDVYLAGRDARTVSMVVRDTAWKANVVPYLAGALAGHFFLNGRTAENRWQLALATVPVVVLYDLLLHDSGRPVFRHPAIPFAAGLVVGGLLWRQSYSF